MRLENLAYLIEISRCQSLNKAADNLFMTQPALNLAITALEKELGFSLIKRSKKGTVLTAAGWQVVEDSKMILNCVDSWKRFSDPATAMIKDVVHITTFESIYQIVIMDILLELKKNYPALDIYCYRSPRNDTTAVLSDKFNIALLAFTPFENEEQESLNLLAKNHWQAEYIGEYQFVAFISNQNDLSKQADIALADLDNQTIAIPPETRYPYSQLVKSLNCKDILYIADKSSILSLVAKNSTISFFPSIRIKNNFYIENDLICAKAIRDFPNVFHQYLIYPEKNLSQAELLVIDAIRSRHKQILS